MDTLVKIDTKEFVAMVGIEPKGMKRTWMFRLEAPDAGVIGWPKPMPYELAIQRAVSEAKHSGSQRVVVLS